MDQTIARLPLAHCPAFTHSLYSRHSLSISHTQSHQSIIINSINHSIGFGDPISNSSSHSPSGAAPPPPPAAARRPPPAAH